MEDNVMEDNSSKKEKKHSKKGESSRLNAIYVINVLSKFSDEDHPISATDIKRHVDNEFGMTLHSDEEAVISVDTVKRILDELADRWFPIESDVDKFDIEYKFGYYIHTVMKVGKEFRTYRQGDGQAPKKYYYYENNLKLPELVTIKDAMETYCFFNEEDLTEIVRKIISLRPMSFPEGRYYDVASRERDDNSMVIMNIEYLHNIIKNRSGAKIVYGSYNIDKQLEKRDGYPKVVEPVNLVWSNGYYYLLAYNLKYDNLVSLRVDRIMEIEEVALDKAHSRDSFNPVRYRHEHPVMFSGQKVDIVLLCRDTGKNHIMNSIIDVFGKNIHVSEANDKLIAQYVTNYSEADKKKGIKWLKVSFSSTVGGMEMWATQYCADCIVVSPEESRMRVKNNIMQGMRNYEV